jgi:hypothetical protein
LNKKTTIMQNQKNSLELEQIITFLSKIGIEVIEKELDTTTFLPGLSLGANCIYVDFEKLLYPGDILHEAGHIAVTPACEREWIGTDKMSKDWPTQGDEIVAILWSYAALHHLKLPLDFVFHANGYKDSSDWFISNFSNQNYMGLPLLEWMGLTLSQSRAKVEGKKAFPEMQQWLRS